MGLVGIHVVLLLMQPDFSSSLVYFPILLGMLYAAGAQGLHLLGYMLFGAFLFGIPLLHTFLKVQPKLLEASTALNFLCKSLEGGMPTFIILMIICALVLLWWWLMRQLRFFIPLFFPLILIGIILAGSLGSSFVQHGLKEYQRKRLIVFLNPSIDPLGSGYNIMQSQVAIGSGKLFGKGYMSGTQSRLGFLPERHTDFIYSVIGEELGFMLSLLIILIYFMFIWRAFAISLQSRDRYGSLVAIGIACMFGFYAITNIGMVMGIMPVTGLPLPFLSYGGSSMVGSMIAVGILLSIHIRRFTH
jgi:rod shape determining protein RodA